jgi:putative ABC transport system permease protein
VGLQAAVSIFLLVGAILLARSAIRVANTEMGFDADKLLAIQPDLPRTPAYYDREAGRFNDNARAYLQAAVATVRTLRSVEGVSLDLYPPFGFSRATTRAFSHTGGSYTVYSSRSDAAYFRTSGFRIIRGRGFTEDEATGGAPVALISESVARDFFGDADPIGQTLAGVRTPFAEDAEMTVIGIVADAMTFGLETERHGNLYMPIGPNFTNPPTLMVRTAHPAEVAHAVETALLTLNPGIRLTTQIPSASAASYRKNKESLAATASAVALVAFFLAILGVYGVTAFVLSQRTQEIGIRMTLGATPGGMLSLLVGQSLRPIAGGVVIGLLAALGAAQVLASMFGGMSPRDPISIGLAVIALVGGSLAAVIGPARLAARTDPASVLRNS